MVFENRQTIPAVPQKVNVAGAKIALMHALILPSRCVFHRFVGSLYTVSFLVMVQGKPLYIFT